jgi:uncharacterized protein (DUF1501 family)
MLDPDISTEDAKRLLSFDDRTAQGLNRRRFLQMVGAGLGAGVLSGGLTEILASGLIPDELSEAWAAGPAGPNDGIVVLVGFDGGNDFLNTTVPYTNGDYYAQRGNLAIPPSSVLPLDGAIGLNSRLGYLKALWDRGQVAVVQGVGYANPDLSHFSSMAFWLHGTPGNPAPQDGWIGRWLDGRGDTGPFAAATVGSALPLSLVGRVARGTAVPPWGIQFGGGTSPHDQRLHNAVRQFSAASAGRGELFDAVSRGMGGVIDVGQGVSPVFTRPLEDNEFVKKMTLAARLINANLGLRVIDASVGGFDTHSSQPDEHGNLLSSFDAALLAFYTTLNDRFRSRVTIMTYSEFGRTSYANDSDGTDHGTAGTHFIIGPAVRGGLYGQMPSLANLDRWDRLAHHVDYRTMYATLIDSWLGGGASSVLGGNFGNLNVFSRGPGGDVPTGGVPPSVLGDFVSITPSRLYDSRYGTGGRTARLGAGTTAEVQVLGVGGVPASDVTAVAVNVVAVAATATTSMTVWPTGEPQPNVANVRSLANRAVPNLAIVKVGQGGRINVLNDLGTANLVVDVTGYFRGTAADRLQPVTPFRALDTRDGTGGRLGPIGTYSSYDLRIAGLGPIPPNASAVVLNLTATQPTAKGFATVWPLGVPRPLAASVNFEPGQTVPNLVMAKLGVYGMLSIYNENGATHFVADVLGYMTPTSPARHFPLPAARLYDATAGDKALGPNSSINIPVLNRGGVPASGVSAVALNISAIDATANTFLTAWPGGEGMPLSANLNPLVNTPVSNLAIIKVGAGGVVQLFNKNGNVKPVIDVVGYFAG